MSQVVPTAVRQFQTITPVFAVASVVKSAEYYRDVLGFRFDRYWGEPPSFVMLTRDKVDIFLSGTENPDYSQPNRRKHGNTPWNAYIWVEDVTTLLSELRARGAKIVSGPDATFYQTIEFVVEDPDGHRLCFAQDTLHS
jgi:catechol 2,3-dioxygenase-like lactoylglutathione lyase family enzyme